MFFYIIRLKKVINSARYDVEPHIFVQADLYINSKSRRMD
jgi:hypothetical protein